MRVGVGGAWLVLDTGKGGFKEKRLGITALNHRRKDASKSKELRISMFLSFHLFQRNPLTGICTSMKTLQTGAAIGDMTKCKQTQTSKRVEDLLSDSILGRPWLGW